LTGKAQIQFLAEPFHRMFFLDNLAIGYPHAEVERVSVCASNRQTTIHMQG
jgi:diacylglycerol diphosphate phosphatase/phosphatidate phosphatase